MSVREDDPLDADYSICNVSIHHDRAAHHEIPLHERDDIITSQK